MIFIDFWGENPFTEIGLSIPPVPSGDEISKKIRELQGPHNQRTRKLHGRKDEESVKESEKLQAEIKRLNALRSELVKKAQDLAEALPFDTLLAIEPVAPVVFSRPGTRASIVAEAWSDIWGEEDYFSLSDLQRSNFRKDFARNSLLDD